MEKLYLQGGRFWDWPLPLSSCPSASCAFPASHHLLVNHRFQFGSDDFPTARTAFIVQPFRTAEILPAGRIEDTHKRISAVPALDFPPPAMCGWLFGRTGFSCCSSASCGKPAIYPPEQCPHGEPAPAFGLSSRFSCWASHPPLIQITAVCPVKSAASLTITVPWLLKNSYTSKSACT